MKKKTVFLLQGNKEINEELKEKFDATEEYEVVGTSVDAISAISMIADKKPNFLITELVLSGYDGLSVIEKVKKENENIKCIVVGSVHQSMEELFYKKGTSCIMSFPMDYELLRNRIEKLYKSKKIEEEKILMNWKKGKEL